VAIMRLLAPHPQVVALTAVYEDERAFHLVCGRALCVCGGGGEGVGGGVCV
jgi:hypothetical protein